MGTHVHPPDQNMMSSQADDDTDQHIHDEYVLNPDFIYQSRLVLLLLLFRLCLQATLSVLKVSINLGYITIIYIYVWI